MIRNTHQPLRAAVKQVLHQARASRPRSSAGALAMLALSTAALSQQTEAADYVASDEAQLRQAIVDANADPDASATITLTANIPMASATAFPTATKPITVDTGGFTVSGFNQPSGTTTGNSVPFAGVTVVNSGHIVGGAAFSASSSSDGTGGIGLSLTNGSLTNNATITGGTGGDSPGVTGAGQGGRGALLTGGSHVNNGTITGGTGGVDANGTIRRGGGGLSLNNGSLTNNGTIQSGASANGGTSGSAGGFSLVGTSTLTNNGTIRGSLSGSNATAYANVGLQVSGTATVTNSGTIEGGTGGTAILVNPLPGVYNLTLVNSGTIRTGGPAANAIQFGLSASATSILELHAGSVIEGNVVGSAANVNDTLRLGGNTSSATFDVSAIGAAAQYRNFNIFQKTGTSTWTLTGTTSDIPAWQLQGGTLSVSSVNQMGTNSIVFDGGTLRVTAPITRIPGAILNAGGGTFQTDADLVWRGSTTGTGALTKTGLATLTVTSLTTTWSGGTTISEGTLQLGNGGTLGQLPGNVVNNAALAFNRTNALTVGGLISGSGAVIQRGTGTTILTGNNTYAGATNVDTGTLRINGDQSAATGLVSVANGATLGGSGTIGGAVTVADGGHLAPGNSPGTLTMGALTVSAGSLLDFELGQANVAGGTFNDLINVNGNLTLDGTLNVALSPGGTYGAGIYRLINYTGTLTNNGLDLGLMPASSVNYVQTSVANQVNLINSQGLVLNYWDGAAATRNDGQITGGDGTWIAAPGNDNWALANGSINAPHQDASIAIFTGTAGTVTVDDSLGAISVSGLQFAANGYRLEGDAITLGAGLNTVRVGDGTDSGVGYTATIASALDGSGTLDKTDLGALVLTGANTHTGGTTISGGTLQLGDGGSSGSLTGDVTNNGTLVFNRSDALTLGGVISGGGVVRQTGTGSTVLAGAGSTTGGLEIEHGALEIAPGASLATVSTTVAAGTTMRNEGTLTGTAGDNTFALAGTFIGSAQLLDGNDDVQIAASANFSQVAFNGGAGVDTLDLTSSTALTLPQTLATGFEHLVKRGNGALTLAGTVDGFSESIAIHEGIVQLGEAAIQTNELSIGAGVSVSGTGSLTGTLRNAGVLSPGNSPGTIQIGGNYVQDAGGRLVSEITRNGMDLLNIAGSATLAGTHQIQIDYGLYLDGTTHTLIQAAGGISGAFETVELNPSALMSADHEIGATGETVSFARQATTTITDPDTNQARFAQWLDEQIAAGGLTPEMTSYIDTLLQQPTAEQAKSLLGQVAEPPAAISQGSVSTLGAGYARTVFDRFALGDGVQCGPAQASSDVVNCSWVQGLRQWGDADGDRFGPSYDWTTDGGQLGFDRRLFSWTVGATFGYAQTDLSDAQGATNALRSKMGGVYASYAAGPIGVDALAFYSENDNRTQRSVLLGSESQAARASFDSDSYGVGARISYRITEETRALVRPFAEVFYDRIDGTRFTERDAGAGTLAVRIHDRHGLRGTAGLQLAEQYEGHGRVFRPALEIGVAHQFGDTQSTLDVQPFSGDGFFRTRSVALDSTSYVARASLGISLGKNAGLTLGYSGELADDHAHHEASLGVRVAW